MLLITLGDPHSVNVELLAPLLAAEAKGGRQATYPHVLIGSAWHWRDQTTRLGLSEAVPYEIVETLADAPPGHWSFLDIGEASLSVPAERLSSEQRGELAVRALEALHSVTTLPRLAVVTAPIDKHAASLAGFKHPGQTEFFESLWGTDAVMILAGPRLRVGLATNHLPLREVVPALSIEKIAGKAALFAKTLREAYGFPQPRLAILAVNPHAGDGGLFGDEDELLVRPAVERARALAPFARFDGPLPADTAFFRAYAGAYDGVLAQYHDQGLGPLKTVHFDDAVNLSGGLAHLRVSPDHGPAADLFLKGQASNKSFDAALAMARRYLKEAKHVKEGAHP